MQGDFKGIAPLEVAIEILFAIEMYQQPAVPLIAHEDSIPRFFIAHVKPPVTDEAAPHACRHSSLEPLVDESMKIIHIHHVETGIWITKENRIGAFAKIVLSATQGDHRRFDGYFDFVVFRIFCCYRDIVQEEPLPRKPCE